MLSSQSRVRAHANSLGSRHEPDAADRRDRDEASLATATSTAVEPRRALQSALSVLGVALETLEKQRMHLDLHGIRDERDAGLATEQDETAQDDLDVEFRSRLVLPDLAVVLQSVGKTTPLQLPVLQFV